MYVLYSKSSSRHYEHLFNIDQETAIDWWNHKDLMSSGHERSVLVHEDSGHVLLHAPSQSGSLRSTRVIRWSALRTRHQARLWGGREPEQSCMHLNPQYWQYSGFNIQFVFAFAKIPLPEAVKEPSITWWNTTTWTIWTARARPRRALLPPHLNPQRKMKIHPQRIATIFISILDY